MIDYQAQYSQATGRQAPANAALLTPLFEQIASGQPLPPRSQQAVDLGLTAHALSDSTVDPPLFAYYRWVLLHALGSKALNEVTAQLIGSTITIANIFQTDLPQPITINPWQINAMLQAPLLTQRAVVIENNGTFILLHELHPDWPLILQAGNGFTSAYVAIIQQLEARGVALTYLGDLDSRGLQMADHFLGLLQHTSAAVVTAIQTPDNVRDWVVLYKQSTPASRFRAVKLTASVYQAELQTLRVNAGFVEQEQLLGEYEVLIDQWLIQ
ncbi:DUF2399 domain-containing protein [Lacticaseibacillus baoqingensis]|uniref:DUF2399 domain-containing protein n=1 Tax=Lacticaseibacillus baoqingensis TaxID=2486013 RepID=A0ABW4E7V1_9LACO|nr:DUF2399 domain-containing protein [Lacticaseibacillus baoqingensis]